MLADEVVDVGFTGPGRVVVTVLLEVIDGQVLLVMRAQWTEPGLFEVVAQFT
jgi:hypothetical protein